MTRRADDQEDVEEFVTRYVSSVAQLEILMLLRDGPDQARDAETVGRELRMDVAWALAELRELAALGFLAEQHASPTQYRYAPASAELEHGVDRLANAYASRRTTVIGLIYRKPSKNVLGFADAFRLRRERE